MIVFVAYFFDDAKMKHVHKIRWPTTHIIVCVGNVLVLISYCGKVSELIHHELKFCRAERLAGLIGTAIDRQPNGAALVLQSCQIH